MLADPSVGRRRKTSGLLAFGVLACVTLFVRPASANEPPIVISLAVTGRPMCADRAALEREVRRRAEQVIFSSSEEARVTFDVKIVERVDGLDATIFIQRSGQPPAARVISAGNCEELLEGTALVIAVVLSGHEREPSTPGLHSDTSQDTASPRAARLGSSPPRQPSAADTEASQPSASPATESGPSARFHMGGGAAAVLSTGIGPGLMPGLEAFLSVGLELDEAFPELMLGLRRIERSDVPVNDARTSFRLTSGFVSLCPLAVEMNHRFSLRPCAVGSYGDLLASGQGIENARSERHPFAGAGVGLRLEAAVLPILSLGVAASSEVALVKSRFHLDGETFHETAPVTGQAALVLTLRL